MEFFSSFFPLSSKQALAFCFRIHLALLCRHFLSLFLVYLYIIILILWVCLSRPNHVLYLAWSIWIVMYNRRINVCLDYSSLHSHLGWLRNPCYDVFNVHTCCAVNLCYLACMCYSKNLVPFFELQLFITDVKTWTGFYNTLKKHKQCAG